MNKLSVAKRAQILSMLWRQGSSMRLVRRVADVSFNTVDKLFAGCRSGMYQVPQLRAVRNSSRQGEECPDRKSCPGRRWRYLDLDGLRRGQQADHLGGRDAGAMHKVGGGTHVSLVRTFE
jgi:hypothetical protein